MGQFISLTVMSIDNINLATSETMVFDAGRMDRIMDNQNPATALTITEAGDTGNVLSAWAATGGVGSEVFDGLKLWWSFETLAGTTTRVVNLYRNSARTALVATGSATIANGASASINLYGVGDSNLAMSVTATIGGGGATNDNDSGNTLYFSNVSASIGLGLNGDSQFIYQEGVEKLTKFTVDETVAEIEALIAGS